ncbi:MAG: phosphatase PAP2 family protein [Treponemataceae bacterium]
MTNRHPASRPAQNLREALFLTLFIAVIASPTHAGGSGSFTLDWKKELAIGLPGAALFAYGHFATAEAPEQRTGFGWIDESLTFPYNKTIDRIGDISQFAAIAALPLLLDSITANEAATVAVMYAESALWAFALKDTLKAAFGRPRPYLSRADTPTELLSDDDRYFSFPSGHATFSFMTASFATYIYSRGNTSAASKWVLGAGVYALAIGTSALRVGGGVHYTADVLVGALLGSAIGIIVPALHELTTENWKISLAPDTISVSYSY